MTFAHGWRGAAIGTVAANLGIGLTLPDFQREGAVDGITLLAQQALIVAIGALLALGDTITRVRQRARSAAENAQDAIAAAGTSRQRAEQALRRHLLIFARMQAQLDSHRQELVSWLQQHRNSAAAMELHQLGAAHRHAFEAYAAALYPLQVEHDGLHAVISGDAFARFWVGELPVRRLLRGDAATLSLDLQLSAYRAICSCLVTLCATQPRQYLIALRTGQAGNQRWIAIRVKALGGVNIDQSPQDIEELRQRAVTHGGDVRRRAHGLFVLLSEFTDPSVQPPRHRPRRSHSA